ncbi:hypothetical protein CHS0354_018458 [Potamilus streckersoni]|uniref:4Fe-4S Mo/W bis-MGD-type domain-containing protein n=1 Tax=Potamilus streckersoni TaxID=2493646 RepID=A0AAE0TAM1_9BIVA|nr:hypothetical protein CHS0354_018458 [Potamilus streckersoni]
MQRYVLYILLTVGAVFSALSAQAYDAETFKNIGQPIKFSHKTHALTNQISCEYCHTEARRSKSSGIPAVRSCVGCHIVIAGTTPEQQTEIKKVLDYWEKKESIPWKKIHDLPDHANFSHKRHVTVGLDCTNCHGDVKQVDGAPVPQDARGQVALTMGWCISCHREQTPITDKGKIAAPVRKTRGGDVIAEAPVAAGTMQAKVDCVNRRDFFKIAASGGAGLALASCNNDGVEDIIPKLLPPDNMVTGTPYHFNTICRECSSGCGITLKTREGRVLTAAGNEKHPINKGAICPVGQASVQGLYNPARIKKPILKGEETAWEDALKALAEQIKSAKAAGKKIVLLTAPETGVLSDLTDEFLTQTGGERLELDVNADNTLRLVSEKLFGVYEKPAFHFDRARVLINFGSDFLESWNTPTENAKNSQKCTAIKTGAKHVFITSRTTST